MNLQRYDLINEIAKQDPRIFGFDVIDLNQLPEPSINCNSLYYLDKITT